ncbi:hypothetical protein AB0C02_30340 [Micromonospora sp. NPDC048999]|uniref:hypothetical protein n=1 Tax=Micromonospora sp. NPDC048999 TaxID=3155391 RepID=UPI0033C5DD18
MNDWLINRMRSLQADPARSTGGAMMNARTVARCIEALPHRLGDTHLPDRPAWTCQTCPDGPPWPCSPARTRLAEAYGPDRSGLATYVNALLFAAAGDLPRAPAVELHERFISWTK